MLPSNSVSRVGSNSQNPFISASNTSAYGTSEFESTFQTYKNIFQNMLINNLETLKNNSEFLRRSVCIFEKFNALQEKKEVSSEFQITMLREYMQYCAYTAERYNSLIRDANIDADMKEKFEIIRESNNRDKQRVKEVLNRKVAELASGIFTAPSDGRWIVSVMENLEGIPKIERLASYLSGITDQSKKNEDLLKKTQDLSNKMQDLSSRMQAEDASIKVENAWRFCSIIDDFKKLPNPDRAVADQLSDIMQNVAKCLLMSRIEEMSSLLKVSEHLGIPVHKISQEHIAAFYKKEKENQVARADAMMKALIEEDARNQGQKKVRDKNVGKKQPGKKTGKKPQQSKPQAAKLNSKSGSEKPKSVADKNLKGEFIQRLCRQAGTVAELERVTKRWREKNPEIIRQFEDRDHNDLVVQRYKHLSEEEVAVQRARHYLPGTEALLWDAYTQKVYTFPTDRGFGMFAELRIGRNSELGVIYFGVGADKVVYHKYFTPLKEAGKDAAAMFNDPTKDIASVIEKRKESKAVEQEWQSRLPFIIETDESGGMLFQYPEEKHSVRIFPLRKDFLKVEFHKDVSFPKPSISL